RTRRIGRNALIGYREPLVLRERGEVGRNLQRTLVGRLGLIATGIARLLRPEQSAAGQRERKRASSPRAQARHPARGTSARSKFLLQETHLPPTQFSVQPDLVQRGLHRFAARGRQRNQRQ